MPPFVANNEIMPYPMLHTCMQNFIEKKNIENWFDCNFSGISNSIKRGDGKGAVITMKKSLIFNCISLAEKNDKTIWISFTKIRVLKNIDTSIVPCLHSFWKTLLQNPLPIFTEKENQISRELFWSALCIYYRYSNIYEIFWPQWMAILWIYFAYNMEMVVTFVISFKQNQSLRFIT